MRGVFLVFAVACGTNLTPQPAPTPVLPDCTPNLDGVIEARELPIAIGASLDFYAKTNAPVDLVGANGIWDMSVETNDPVVAVGPTALGSQWYAPSFPSGQFVVDAGAGLDGVFHQDDEALWLDGTASHDENPAAGKTLVIYADPVATLRFPLSDGAAWSTVAPLTSATVDGLPFIGTDTFDIDATGSGRLDVPYVDFEPVLRVRSQLTRKPSAGAPSVSTRTTSFLFECFGEVAHADSAVDEANPDFTTAASLRRFALGVTP